MRWVITALTFIVTATSALQCFYCDDCERETAQLIECIDNAQCYSILGPVTRRGCARSCPFNWKFVDEECYMCEENACNYHTHNVPPLHQPVLYHNKRSHKLSRHRRDEKTDISKNSHITATHYLPDGTRVEVYKEFGDAIPSLPTLQDEIMFLNPADSRFGSIDEHGNIYVPIDEFGEVLPEYSHLIKGASRFSMDNKLKEEFRSKLATEHEGEAEKKAEMNPAEVPVDIKLMETEMLTPDGDVVKQIITDIQPVNLEEKVSLEENTKEVEQAPKLAGNEKKSEAEIEFEAAGVLQLPKPKQTKEELQEAKEEQKLPFEIKKDMTSEELAEAEAMLAELYGWTDEPEEEEGDKSNKEDLAKNKKQAGNRDGKTEDKERVITEKEKPTTILYNTHFSSVHSGSSVSFFCTLLVTCVIACFRYLS